MALLFQDGFDSGIHKWTSNTGPAVVYSTTAGVYGEGAITLNPGTNDIANTIKKIFKTSDNTDTSNPLTRLSFFMKTNTTVSSTSTILEIGDQNVNAATNGRIAITTAGILAPYRAGQNATTITGNTTATYPSRLDDGNWHHVEMELKYDNTAGVIAIYVDGANVYSYAGNTNWNTLSSSGFRRVDYVTLGNIKASTQISFDDIVVWDDTGANTIVGLQGPMRIFTLRPTADTAQADSTPSTGVDRWAMVDDVGQPDGDGTYVTLPVLGKDIYEIADLPAAAATANIRSMSISMSFNSSTFGRANVRPIAVANGITWNGNTSNALSRTYSTPTLQFEITRDFGNSNSWWTASSVSSLKIGVENVG